MTTSPAPHHNQATPDHRGKIAATNRLIFILASLVAFGPLSIDMYLPALPAIAQAMSVATSRIQTTIGVFLGGFGVGMLFYGPLSDRFGRRRLLIGSIGLYTSASIFCFFAQTADQLIGFRLVQALGGAGTTVLSRAIVRDIFPPDKTATTLSWIHMITMLAALLAPSLGGVLLKFIGWRSIFAMLAIISLLIGTIIFLFIPETLPKAARKNSILNAFHSYGKLLTEMKSMTCILVIGLSFGGMFAYISASPFVYIDYFSLSPNVFALIFGLNIIGVMLVTFLNTRLLKRFRPQQLLRLGSGVAACSGLALYLVCRNGAPSTLPWTILFVAAYVSVTGMIGANALACLLNWYPRHAGAAAGLAVALQFGLGAVFNGLVAWFDNGTPFAMGFSVGLAGCGTLIASWLAGRHTNESLNTGS